MAIIWWNFNNSGCKLLYISKNKIKLLWVTHWICVLHATRILNLRSWSFYLAASLDQKTKHLIISRTTLKISLKEWVQKLVRIIIKVTKAILIQIIQKLNATNKWDKKLIGCSKSCYNGTKSMQGNFSSLKNL